MVEKLIFILLTGTLAISLVSCNSKEISELKKEILRQENALNDNLLRIKQLEEELKEKDTEVKRLMNERDIEINRLRSEKDWEINMLKVEMNKRKVTFDDQKQIDEKEFSIISDKGSLSLLNFEKDFDFTYLFGKPLEQKMEVLGIDADTHAGSSVKTLKYEGLTIKLFSPSNIEGMFWVMNMNVYGQNFKTFRNISVGNTLSNLKEAYGNIIQALDGRTDPNNCAYTIKKDQSYIWFEIKNGIIKEIKYYFEIP
jgi:hypothetical protein